MPDQPFASREPLPRSAMRRVYEQCDRFDAAWQAGERPRIEDYLGETPEPERSRLLAGLLRIELFHRRNNGEPVARNEYCQRFPQHAELVDAAFAEKRSDPGGQAPSSDQQVETGPELAPAEEPLQPLRLGRYRVAARLGAGGFGVVYRGYDEELYRDVAIKVPHRRQVSAPKDVETYLAEARVLASLDHPHIVPVYDVGRTPDGLCYVVSKFIEGSDLAKKIKAAPLPVAEAAELIATIAEALHYAHRKGLVHRDVKPANILIDTGGKPYVADFGLALKEQDFGKKAGFLGTPAYASPEQARGEGHRVDGRADIFSLGVVLYELLTGRRPFRADSAKELLEQIATVEPRPPRQVDDTIPKELERICLKALSKRASERYTTARDMADDLRHFREVKGGGLRVEGEGRSTPPATRIVPKGLRSFDEHDADFFLELLPGPRDRDGLPESIRFWKSRIEETEPDKTFAVGLMYGPSGCGKSSVVKAGLLPRLGKAERGTGFPARLREDGLGRPSHGERPSHITAVYIEAGAEETEGRLLKGLRRLLPELPADLGLVEALAALRRGEYLQPGHKVLLVLDQFEQWLHAGQNRENTELVQALRQCDGSRVQCLVLVRDDFWLAVSRFMQALEIRILEGENSRLVDLFDPRHATKVLTAFGQAFGALPEKELSKDQSAFLAQAVAGLAEDGKVISVRLALFAEMVKGKPWMPATLKEVGGMEGVGVTFLEEQFTASGAPPPHRFHQKAAQAVLKALLPEAGTDIKGTMRSWAELLDISGYRDRPKEFEEVVRILDGELRLITPTDPEGVANGGRQPPVQPSPQAPPRYYQLTHDYLVPSLREWLTRKQKETRRGRAELVLADRTGVWNARRENRQLPSLWQWGHIRWLTQKKNWTPPERRMMRKASRYHALRGAVGALLLTVASVTGLALWERVEEGRKRAHAADLVQSVLNADTAGVPAIVGEMAEYRRWVDPLLKQEFDAAASNSRQKLHASLALLPVDASQVAYLYGRLLDALPPEVPVIRDTLAPHQDELVDRLWAVVEAPPKAKESQRLRAAAALAAYDPQGEKWARLSELVVQDLTRENPFFLGPWSEAYRPVKNVLLGALAEVFRDQRPERAAERTVATNLLADYGADQPHFLADLLMDANEKQFAVIYPKVQAQAERSLPVLTAEIDQQLPADLPSSDERREKLGKRQANAAVALLRLNQPEKVWPVLKHSPDPRARSYLIHRLFPLGADAGAISRRLDEEPDITIRRALLLSLGESDDKGLPPDERQELLPRVQEMYQAAPDAGLHAAAEWLLRTWKQDDWLKQVNEEWATKRVKGEGWWVEGKNPNGPGTSHPSPSTHHPSPGWYVNAQGQTMVVIPGPVEFLMGSPTTEADRAGGPQDKMEQQHPTRIERSFAIASKEVTVAQFLAFRKTHSYNKVFSPGDDDPINMVSWYDAAAYCNWLSGQEGLPEEEWCYLPVGYLAPVPRGASAAALGASPLGIGSLAALGTLTSRRHGLFEEGMRCAPNYLQRTGYRLPTEAEWEYACRAGAVTSRFYGETEELLVKYGWYTTNSRDKGMLPSGSLKPNDLGLFDMYGNALEWCQDVLYLYRIDTVLDAEDINVQVRDKTGRVLRGGSFVYQASLVRSALRDWNVQSFRVDDAGLRPARTLTP